MCYESSVLSRYVGLLPPPRIPRLFSQPDFSIRKLTATCNFPIVHFISGKWCEGVEGWSPCSLSAMVLIRIGRLLSRKACILSTCVILWSLQGPGFHLLMTKTGRLSGSQTICACVFAYGLIGFLSCFFKYHLSLPHTQILMASK